MVLSPDEFCLSPILAGASLESPREFIFVCLLQCVELTGFTTAILSGVAACIHLITIQIVTNDDHVPACSAGDRTCAEGIGMIVVM